MQEKNDHFSLDQFLRNTIQFYLTIVQYVFKGAKKHWPYAIGIFIVFGLLFFYKSQKTVTYYTAQSSYTFNYLHKKVYGDLLFDIEQLTDRGEQISVSEVLKIPLSTAEKIISLRARNIENSPLHEDFTPQKVPFYVHIEVYSKTELPIIQKAITDYLTQNPFAANVILQEQIKNRENLALIERDIQILDSLARNFSAEEPEKLDRLFNISAYKLNEKLKLRNKLSEKNAVSLLKPFQPIEINKKPLLKALFIKYFAAAIVLSTLLMTFLFWYQNPENEL